jgi:hypothetical protein
VGVAPLLDEAGVEPGGRGQPGAGQRPVVGQSLVEAELVADHHGGGVHRGTEVGDEPSDQIVQLRFVDRRCVRRHRSLLGRRVDEGHDPTSGLQWPWSPAARPLQRGGRNVGP